MGSGGPVVRNELTLRDLPEWQASHKSQSARAAEAGQLRTLRRLAQQGSAKLVGESGEPVEIPATVRTLLAEIARNMEAGKAVSVVAENHELTTRRAANVLGVSRPFLVRLLEESKRSVSTTLRHKIGEFSEFFRPTISVC